MQIKQQQEIYSPNLEYITSKLTPQYYKPLIGGQRLGDVKLKPEESFGLIDIIKKQVNMWHYQYTKIFEKQKKFVQLMSSLMENRIDDYQKIKEKSQDLGLYETIIIQYQKLKIIADNYKNFLTPNYSIKLKSLSQYYTSILQTCKKTVTSKISQITKQPKNDTLTYFMDLVIENRNQLVNFNQITSNRNLAQINQQQLKEQCQLKVTNNILNNIRNMDEKMFKKCGNYSSRDQNYINSYTAEEKLVACCFHRMKSLMNLPPQVSNVYHYLYSLYEPSIKMQIQQSQHHQHQHQHQHQQILNQLQKILNLPPNNSQFLIDRIHQLQENNQILKQEQYDLEKLYSFIQNQFKGTDININNKIQEFSSYNKGKQGKCRKIRQLMEDLLIEQMYGITDRSHVVCGNGQKRDIFDILSKHTNKNITAFQLLYRATPHNRPPIYLNQHLPTPNNLLILFTTNVNSPYPQKGCFFSHNINDKGNPIFINLNHQKMKIEQVSSYQMETNNITINMQQNISIRLSGATHSDPSRIACVRNGKQEFSMELEVLEVYGVSYQGEQYVRECQTLSINCLQNQIQTSLNQIKTNQTQNLQKTKKILQNLQTLKSSLKQAKINKQQLLEMRQQLKNSLTIKIQETMKQISYKLNEFASSKESKGSNDKNIAILKYELQEAQRKNNKLQMQKQRYGASIKFLKAKLDPQKHKQFQQTQFITNKQAITLRSELQQLHQQNSQLQCKYKQSQIQIAQLSQKYKQQLQKNKKELDSKDLQIESMKEKEDEMVGEIKELERYLNQGRQKIQQLEKSLNKGKQQIQQLKKQSKLLKQQNQLHKKQIINVNQQLQTHKKQIIKQKQQLLHKNQEINLQSSQLLKLTESLKQKPKSSQIIDFQPQLKLPTQKQTLYQCFNGRIHLHTHIKKTIIEEIHNNFSGNIHKIRYQVAVTDLLYFYPEMGELNFHRLVDNKYNIVVVIKLREVDHVIVVFSEAMVHNKPTPPNKEQGAFMAILNNPETSKQNRIFYLNKNHPQSRALPYNDYYLVIGNSQLRIKRGTDKVETNIPNIFQYFKTDEFKNPSFMFGDNKTTAQVQRYDIYQVTIKKME